MNSTQPNERTWRDDVMDECLRGFDNDDYEESFLYSLRRSQPYLHTMLFNSNRNGVVNFMRKECIGFEDAILTRYTVQEDNHSWASFGWYKAIWKDSPIEVAFLPDGGYSAIAIAEDRQAIEQFSQAAHNFALMPEKRALRYSSGWEVARDLDKELGNISWDDLTFPSDLLAKIRESVETFFSSKEIIQSFGFAWKRGILLVGPPGTGKTMVCKAAATALPDLPFLYVRDLRERNQKESIEAIFKRARKLAPCLLVFEDLDSLINEHNRTVFLNEMDGFASNDGLLIIASSNHPGKIDEALLKRPSRFDRVFHLGLPELAERRAFCEKILTRDSLASKLSPGFDIASLCDQVAAKSDGFTPAYLKEAFVSAALSRAQEGATTLDERFALAVLEQLGELKAHLKKVKNPDAMAEMRSGDDAIGLRR